MWHTKSAKETEKDLKTSIKNGLTDKEIEVIESTIRPMDGGDD